MPKVCMLKELKGKKYRCYFELALLIIGGKWKPVILFHLAQGGVMRYSELRRCMPGVTERMLARQLRELEKDGLVRREVFREVPPRVEYRLTPQGCAVIPALIGLREWGVVYDRHLGGPGRFEGGEYESPEPVVVNPECLAQAELVRQGVETAPLAKGKAGRGRKAGTGGLSSGPDSPAPDASRLEELKGKIEDFSGEGTGLSDAGPDGPGQMTAAGGDTSDPASGKDSEAAAPEAAPIQEAFMVPAVSQETAPAVVPETPLAVRPETPAAVLHQPVPAVVPAPPGDVASSSGAPSDASSETMDAIPLGSQSETRSGGQPGGPSEGQAEVQPGNQAETVPETRSGEPAKEPEGEPAGEPVPKPEKSGPSLLDFF